MNLFKYLTFSYFIITFSTIYATDIKFNKTLKENSKYIQPTTSSTKTNWGFQPFTIPNYSVTVQAGGNIQNAINSLPNGGTVKLAAGTFYANRVHLKSNLVLEGAGRGQTIIKFKGKTDAYLINASGSTTKNIIIRNLTLNATGNGNANGVEITYGVNNVLIENIEIFGAGKSNLIVWNPDWKSFSKHITYKNINSHYPQWHGFALRFVIGAIIENCEASYSVNGNGWDLSRVIYGEVANNWSYNNVSGSKYPGSSYIYMHDNYIENNSEVGIKFNRLTGAKQYLHMENNVIINSTAGVVDWGDKFPTPTFAELVLKGNKLLENNSNKIRIRGADKLYEYNDNIGITKARIGTVTPIRRSGTPENDNVGYTSWPTYN